MADLCACNKLGLSAFLRTDESLLDRLAFEIEPNIELSICVVARLASKEAPMQKPGWHTLPGIGSGLRLN